MNRLCILLVSLLLAGCAKDPEDAYFFNRGWLNPHKDLDLDPAFDGPPKRPGGMPHQVHPEKYQRDPIVDA